MGCGGSKTTQVDRTPSRKYLHNAHLAADVHNQYGGASVYLPSTGPLTAREYKERLTTSEGTQTLTFPKSGYTLRYAYVSQRGYYPDSPDKPNQDAFCIHTNVAGDSDQALFGVFDGHGEFGTQCSHFARDKVPENLLRSGHFVSNPTLACHNAMVATNVQCHRADFDDSMSGTTAIVLLVRDRKIVLANVGDSRAVLADRRGNRIYAVDLSIDQTPYRADECDRVRAMGARVLTLDQVEGLKDPTVECWTTEEEDDGDPPRLWFPNGMYPGTAFTRSIGDGAAERIGVFAEPEVETRALSESSAFIVMASDGVFEFLSSQSVVDMVSKFDDPHEAALSVVAESYRLWLQYETRTDDITMIIVQFSGLEEPVPQLPRPTGPGGTAFLDLERAASSRLQLGRPPSFRQRLGLAARVADIEAAGDTDQEDMVGEDHAAPKPPELVAMLEEAVRSNFLFSHLTSSERATVFAAMERVPVQAGDVVIRQGDQGDDFFIAQEGAFKVLVDTDGSSAELVHTYMAVAGQPRPSFGELALLYGKPRAASVIAASDGVLWRLNRHAFKKCLQARHSSSPILKTLRAMEMLEPLTTAQLQTMAELLRPANYSDGSYVCIQGQEETHMYIVTQGEVVATVRKLPGDLSETPREVLTMSAGQYFGERALLGPAMRQANIVARGEVVLLTISRQEFEAAFGPLQELQHAFGSWRKWLGLQNGLMNRRAVLGPCHAEILQGTFQPENLVQRSVLWAAQYVHLADMAHANQDLALSARLFDISAVEQGGHGDLVKRQRQITSALPPCLFVPHTIMSWRSMSASPGPFAGEALATIGICTLDAILQLSQSLDINAAVYVAACVVVALEHLHYLGITYRGLCTSSIVLTESGLVQLTDFRFASKSDGRAYTLCGVPEYMAPEVIEGVGHAGAADWWSLGVLLFHMLAGSTPFAAPGDDELKIYKRIVRGMFATGGTLQPQQQRPGVLSALPTDAADLILQLLDPDPVRRLGGAVGGVRKLQAHPFFRTINWEDLKEGRVQLPLALRETLFEVARQGGGGGELQGAAMVGSQQPGGQPSKWLEDF